MVAAKLRLILRSDLGQVFLLFFITRVALYLFAWAISPLVPLETRVRPFNPGLAFPPLAIWSQWDVGGYVGIALRGYRPGNEDIAGFFPLYPLLIKATSMVVPNAFLAGLAVANLAMLGAVLLLYRLTLLEFGDAATARRAAFYLLIYPSAFFTLTAYSEPLLLLLAIASLLAMRQSQWVLAGLWGALAAATRFVGITLLPTLAVALLAGGRRAAWGWGLLGMAIVPLGFVGFSLVLALQMGKPTAYFTVGTEHFGREVVPPWVSLSLGWEVIQGKNLHPDFLENWSTNLLNFLSACLFLGLSVASFLQMRRGPLGYAYGVYMATGLLLALSASHLGDRPLAGMLRYNLTLFPGFMLLARYGRHPLVDHALTLIFALVLGVLTLLFVRQWNVAGVS